ncbi:hypothetical protein GC163_08065 [bacterium]|nr:hypothetical protein [bacterium]
MSTIVIASEIDTPPVEIPGGIQTLTGFRRWVFSSRFPETGRIDYVRGRIEVDMAADDLFVHNFPKTELTSKLYQLVRARDLGWLFAGGARVSCPEAELSVEPDVVFVSHRSYDSGEVAFRKSKSESHTGYVEIVGAPDLVIEVVSDSSVRKDTRLLPESYFAAGVSEFWLVDCRRNHVDFNIHTRGRGKFKLIKPDAEGWRESLVLQTSFRLSRKLVRPEIWQYDLETR